MASIAKFDQWQNTAGVNYNTVLQVVQTTYKSQAAFSGTALQTWPVSVTITPKFATSKILVTLTAHYQPTGETYVQGYIYRNGSRCLDLSSNISSGSSVGVVGGSFGITQHSDNGNNVGKTLAFSGLDSPGTTSAVTYDIRTQTNNGSYNGYYIGTNTSIWAQSGPVVLTAMEIAQ